MLSFSLLLRQPPPDSLASRIGWRAEVCPPSLREAPLSIWQRLWHWLTTPEPLRMTAKVDRLSPVRKDFLDSLGDVGGTSSSSLSYRIKQTQSLRELWHLRTELYSLLALSHSQQEAERRVSGLNRHFPTRAPRSGLMPLLS